MKNTIVFIGMFLMVSSSINAQNLDVSFFQKADELFNSYVQNGNIDYQGIKKDTDFKSLIETIGKTSFEDLDKNTEQAFLVNAYNLLVINEILKNNITKSVNEKSSFFDSKTNKINGRMVSLNTIEKEYLLKKYGDPRFHFALICGAKGCPPIANFGYFPDKLESQLATQTKNAINDSNFIRVNNNLKTVGFSQIFKWYVSDFGGNKNAILKYINQYRNNQISIDYKIEYYEYDWSLNGKNSMSNNIETDSGNNSSRYVVSAAIPKGTTETKIFNNLYTQRTRENPDGDFNARSNFFTTSVSFLYGLTGRFNAGFDLRYRRVSNTGGDTSPLNVFTNNADSRRSGITSVGPKIRWAPFEQLSNFSLQSTFSIPIGDDLQGNQNEPYIDWDGATWNTQLFNDFPLGTNFSVFTELDFLLEDIGKKEEGDLNIFSTPMTVILSYFPNPKTTLYVLTNYAPKWQSEFDYFAQAGIGAKYQVTSNFELELLYTSFTNKFLNENNGRAATFNFGVRVSM